MIKLRVERVLLLGQADAPVVVLAEVGGERFLPIWISSTAAQAIVAAVEADIEPGPHRLLANLCQLMPQLPQIRIESYADGVFGAALLFGDRVVPCRASDAIALALRLELPLECLEEVLAQAGVTVTGVPDLIPAAEVEKFLEFLEQITPQDFDEPPPSGAPGPAQNS